MQLRWLEKTKEEYVPYGRHFHKKSITFRVLQWRESAAEEWADVPIVVDAQIVEQKKADNAEEKARGN